jgi:adenylate cyclase
VATLVLTITNARQNQTIRHEGGPIEVGRGPQRDVPRLVVEDRYTSRDQLRLDPLEDGRWKITNLGGPAAIADVGALATGEQREISLPARVTFGYSTLDLRLEQPAFPLPHLQADEGSALQTIVAPIRRKKTEDDETRIPLDVTESPSPATLALWFERLLTVQRAAAGSGEFYSETARAMVELIGLDSGVVLLRQSQGWDVAAFHPAHLPKAKEVSQRIVQEVLREKRTFYQSFQGEAWSQSLMGVQAVVASPILDESDTVVGILYGRRDMRDNAQRARGIHPLEAQLVQVLAAAVSAGLARQQREAEAARTRVQFEQFFSSELAQALQRNPALLEGQEREVTVMFADLRGFSGISEIVGARQTYRLLSDIMDRFTIRVMEENGVVIDYYGDGFAAMWNAPTDQEDHTLRACRAAWKMMEELAPINATWEPQLKRTIRIGIGINTGMAQVGNAGSSRRLKYGPRGHSVNLASRIEGATKLLGVPCLLSQFSVQKLPNDVPRRFLCACRVTGLAEPVGLYELPVSRQPAPLWWQLKERYELAWRAYENHNFAECLRLCAELAADVGKDDVPTKLLAKNAATQLASPTVPFEPVYNLDVKA